MAGVEIPFVAKTIDPDAIKGGSKAARRKEVAKKKWHNELLDLRRSSRTAIPRSLDCRDRSATSGPCSNLYFGRSSLSS